MSRKKRPVIAIGIDGDRREYDSVWEAHEDGFHYPKIYRCLKRHSQTHRGYHWRRPAEGKQAEPPNLEEALAWIAEATKVFAELAGGGPDLFTRRGDDFRADVHICRSRILSALISSPGKDGGQEVERDFPAEFEAWWETYRHKNREPADYSVKKQIAFDAFYFAGRPQPASTALVERLTEELTAAASLLETLSEELPDDDVSGVMMRVMAERNRSALSASQSTSKEGESR